ncbi:MAG: 3-oxoacyl-[acyl-carrier protein] reductase [Thermoleophilaceae bacterium]|jgi:3-oxoacyl-[acyl-carrier protein] reductase|nr:3-oxoacyl-[acyl-carrier protein] reductase [Thermoleophilaceae bacterium]
MADRCALVTGGSRGIGAATAVALADAGWPVAVNYRSDEAGAEAVVERIRERGGCAAAIQGDVANVEDVDRLVTGAEETLGRVAVLVNNAGRRADALCPQIRDSDWSEVIATNLSASFWTTRRVLMEMIRARFGRVVNIASIVGLRANPGQANYAASKAGLIGLTKTVAAEVARRGVTVNAVAPGFVETSLSEGVSRQLLDAIPARRPGTVDEVAACVRFLASAEASYVTGQTLVVDGGLSA